MSLQAAHRAGPDVPMAMIWKPPGPVAAAYEASEVLNPLIVGPVGSAKTTTCCRKIMRLAARLPGVIEEIDGRAVIVKDCRVAVVASTHRILWKNLLPSYWKVFPRAWGVWTGGEGEPAVHRFEARGPLQQGLETLYRIQVDFIGIADRALDDVTHGLELTGAYIYEFDTLPPETITKFAGRLGRWPNMPTGAQQDALPRQIWGDCNAFDPDHWAYKECFEEKPPGREVFVQPSALSAQAENIANVGRAYYEAQKSLLKPWEIARLLENRFVPDRPGFVVYRGWNPLLHEAKEPIRPIRGLPLLIGVDQGLKAAAVICQRPARLVWNVLRELTVPPDDVATAGRFARDLADLLLQNFADYPAIAVLDPAAMARSSVAEAQAWAQEFAAHFPYPCQLAVSNRVRGVDGRVAAVENVLAHMHEGRPALQVDPSCRMIKRGFNGGYRFRPQPGQPGVASMEIEKTPESHPHDGLQYIVQTVEALPGVMAEARGGAHAAGKIPAASFEVII